MPTAIIRRPEDIDRLFGMQRGSVESLLETGPVKVEVSRFHEKRTLDQNALSWALYADVARFMNRTNSRVHGDGKMAPVDAQDVHDYFLQEFYPEQCSAKEVGKHTIPVRPKTSRFNSPEMSNHLELIYRWCAERHIPTTEPSNGEYLKYAEAQR